MTKDEFSYPPHIDPRAADPRAARYQAELAARKQAAPVAGGPPPPIPLLTNMEVPEGPPMPMSAHALKERAAAAAVNAQGLLTDPGSLFAAKSAATGLTPNDILPEAAKQDPTFREGAGSMYAVNQPSLAYKYGVIRHGTFLTPQALRPAQGPATGGLKEATIKGLEEVAKFQQKRATEESRSVGDARVEDEAARGPAAAAAKIGNVPGDDSPLPTSSKVDAETLRKLDDFDFDTFRQAMMKDLLNNTEQKEVIEERLAPLDLSDLIIDGYVTQEVVIVPGKFWVAFRSVSGEDDLEIKRLIMQETRAIQVDDRYYLDKFAFMTLTLGLYSICSNPVPSHQVAGKFDVTAFWKKFEFVSRLNTHMAASLGVNYFWFDIRVRKLLVAERIKNG